MWVAAATTTKTRRRQQTTETTETDTTATGSRLIGTVGSESDPDAYVITLTTEDGSAVTTLAAGDYTLEINDLSSIHNFHLTGPGMSTS